MPTDKLFTGQQREPEVVSVLGLYDYGARFWRMLAGRFLSPDLSRRRSAIAFQER